MICVTDINNKQNMNMSNHKNQRTKTSTIKLINLYEYTYFHVIKSGWLLQTYINFHIWHAFKTTLPVDELLQLAETC
jgi:hypothetical protein